jgi:hypothetical protein
MAAHSSFRGGRQAPDGGLRVGAMPPTRAGVRDICDPPISLGGGAARGPAPQNRRGQPRPQAAKSRESFKMRGCLTDVSVMPGPTGSRLGRTYGAGFRLVRKMGDEAETSVSCSDQRARCPGAGFPLSTRLFRHRPPTDAGAATSAAAARGRRCRGRRRGACRSRGQQREGPAAAPCRRRRAPGEFPAATRRSPRR